MNRVVLGAVMAQAAAHGYRGRVALLGFHYALSTDVQLRKVLMECAAMPSPPKLGEQQVTVDAIGPHIGRPHV